MSQRSYGYRQQAAVPGGLFDTSPHSIVARSNEEPTLGAVKFGMGVVQGTAPGANIKLPTEASASALFEGVVTTGIKSMDLQGVSAIGETDTLGILEWGKVWVRLASGIASVAYGDRLYLVVSGDDAGKFSNSAIDAIAVNGKFIGGIESGDIAPVRLFNQDATLADHETRITALG
ncbi:MAG: hypothetical protein LBU13_07670 [Synergistaceae bacterium]|jgi:hypothetical protein|nr:hypothetical protein [Synergistaceae bacterium]